MDKFKGMLGHTIIIVKCVFMFFTFSLQAANGSYHEGFLIVKFQEGNSTGQGIQSEEQLLRRYPELKIPFDRFHVSKAYCPFHIVDTRLQSTYYIHFDESINVREFENELKQFEFIEYVEREAIYEFSFFPNDFDSLNQWSLSKIKATESWNLATTGSDSITIAVLDASFNLNHPDLNGNVSLNQMEVPNNGIDDDNNGYVDDVFGWDVADQDNDPENASGPLSAPVLSHGNFVAGFATGVTNNGIGMASVSHNARIIPVKISTGDPISIPAGAPALALEYAIIRNADVINMSFGAFDDLYMGETMHVLVEIANDNGQLMVAASGNNGMDSTIHFPAAYPEVVAVGATDKDDYKWSWANTSSDIDIMAPGVDVYSLISESPWYESGWSGTSFSSPIVAGALALLKANYPNTSTDQIKECLFFGADGIQDLNPYYHTGAGRLNLFNAMKCMDSIINLGPCGIPLNAGEIAGNQEICFGQNFSEIKSIEPGSGNGPIGYQWYYSIDSIVWESIPGANSDSWHPAELASDPYEETIIFIRREASDCGNNAFSNSVIITINPLPDIQITSYPLSPVCVNGPLYDLEAQPAGGDFHGNGILGTSAYSPNQAGVGMDEIHYSFTSSKGCTSSDTVLVEVISCTVGVMADVSSPNLIVFPNPFEHTFEISGVPGEVVLEIFDLNGRRVLRQPNLNGRITIESELTDGTYILKAGKRISIIQKVSGL